MAYDTASAGEVLFGGASGSTLDSDTWSLSGSAWAALSPATSPPARKYAAAAYDSVHQQVVLFGGATANKSLGDTWVWDGTTWSQKSVSSAPAARSGASMVYDSVRQQIVLFGGASGHTYFNDTWTWNGTAWTQLSPSTSPSARQYGAMAFNRADGTAILFGGAGSTGSGLSDTWKWNGSTWSNVSPTPSPGARYAAGLAYDAASQQLVLADGNSGSSALSDTWTWNGSAWTQATPTSAPSARDSAATAEQGGTTGAVIAFGGESGSTVYNDTWSWTTVPAAPTNLVATAGDRQVSLTWTGALTGGSALTGYTVTPYIGASAQPPTTVAGTATGATITGLTDGTAYTFTVAAANGVGTGPNATSSSVTPVGPPGAPSGVTATAGPAQATVNWTAPATNGSAITQYTVTPYVGATAQTPVSVNAPTTSTTVTNLINGTAYTFQVTATNGVGTGPAGTSNAVTPAAAPGAPTNVAASAGNQQATVTWTAPSDNGSAITGYTITPYIGTQAQTPSSAGATATSATISALTNGTTYTFSVAATNGVGTGPASSSGAVTPAGPPFAPGSVSASPGNTQATVTWVAPGANGSAITGYTVTPYIAGQSQTPVQAGPSATAATVTGLTNGTAYRFTVTATNGVGTGPGTTSGTTIPTATPVTYPPAVLSDTPSLYFRLDENSGTVAADASGNGWNGAYQSGVTLGGTGALVGDPDAAVAGNGTTSIAKTSSSSGLPVGNAPRTVEAWFKTTVNARQGLISYGSTVTAQAFGIEVLNSTQLDAFTWSNDLVFSTGKSITDGSWHYVADVYDGAGHVTVYLDGTSLGTQTLGTQTINTVVSSNGLVLGSEMPGTSPLNGSLDEAAVYPAALQGPRIVAHVQASGNPPGAPINVTASAGTNSATVTWQAGPANGGPITQYAVTAYASGSPVNAVVEPGTATSATLTGLAAGVQYSLQVVANNTYGAGPAGTATATPSGAPTTYATTVLGDNPLLYWRLSEPVTYTNGQYLTPADSSGHGTIGTFACNATTGQAGALQNDTDPAMSSSCGGTAGLANTANLAGLPQGTSARSIEVWVKTTNAYAGVIAGYSGGMSISFPGNGGQYPYEIDFDGRSWILPVTRPIMDGNWHYLVATYDGTNATLYLDATSLGSQSASGGGGNYFFTSAAPCRCGDNWSGSVDEIAVYGTALTQAQVSAHFSASGDSVPTSVSGITVTSATNAATVQWSGSAAAGVPSGATAVLRYTVTAYNGSAMVGAVTAPGNATSATLRGLPAGIPLTFQVVAANQFGAGPPSSSSAVTLTGGTTTYSSTVLADHPSLYWRLDEPAISYGGQNLDAADASGNGNAGVFSCASSPQQTGALANDGNGSMTACGGSGGVAHTVNQTGLPTGSTPRSIEAWFKTNNAYSGVIAGYNGAMAIKFPGNGGQYPYEIDVTGATSDAWIVPATHPILDNNWHQVVAVFDGTNLTLYVDGQSLGAQPYTGSSGNGGFTAGAAPCGCGDNWNGPVDEVAVYPSALTAAQVAAHFSASGDTRPSAVSNLSVSAGPNQATVSWSAASAAVPSGATSLLGHFVTIMQGTTPRGSMSVAGNATSATITGLVTGVTYTAQVYAFNQFGGGPTVASGSFTVTGAPSTYASTVQTDGPLLYWRLAEPSSSYGGNALFAADSSGNGQTGVLSCVSAAAQPGALANDSSTSLNSCGGSGGAARTVNVTGLPVGTAPRTIETWFKTNNAYGGVVVGQLSGMTISFPGNGGQFPWEVDVGGSTGDAWYIPTNRPVLDNNWHQAVASYDGTNVTLYIDGQSYGAKPFTPGTGGRWFTVGASPCGCGDAFNGLVQEAALYPTALSPAQVTAHFNASGDSVPSAVSGLSASGGAGQVTATWAASTAGVPSGATAVLGYVATVYNGSTAVGSVDVPGNATSATIYGVAGGLADTVQVYAYNQFGAGATSTSPTATPSGPSPTYASTVLGDNPSLYWRLGESSSSYGGSPLLAADASGHGNVGTYVCPSNMGQPGAFNDLSTSVYTNGSCRDGVARTSPATQLPTGARTLEAWIKVQSAYGSWTIAYGNFGAGVAFYSHGGDVAHALTTTAGDFYSPPADPILDGTWHQVDLTYDGTTLVAYLDGLFIGSAALSNPGTGPLHIAAASCGCGDNYYGSIQDVAVYDHVLTASQIRNHFNNSSDAGPTPPESFGYFNPSEFLCNCFSTFYPVNDATGNFTHTFEDVSIPGRGKALDFTQTYNSLNSGTPGPLGYGWSHSYQMTLSFNSANGNVTVNQENGSQVLFSNSPSGYLPPSRVLATLAKNGDGTFTFTRKAREIFTFSSTGQLTQEKDLNGYVTSLAYTNGQLTSVTDPAGRTLTLAYTNGQLSSVSDPTGRGVSFQYDGSGNLSALVDVNGGHTTFTYDGSHRMLTMTDPNQGTVTNTYDSGTGRITSQTDGMSRKTSYSYGTGTTAVTDPKGNITFETYRNNKLVSVTKGKGTPQQATWQYTYDPVTLGVATETDPNGHSTSKTYDAAGNVLTTTDGLGRTTINTYDALNDLLTTKDPLGVTTSNTYDASGNKLTSSRPLTTTGQSALTTYTYGDSVHPGDVTAMTDPDDKAWHYAYDQYGDRTQTTDPAGDLTTAQYNSIGWETSSVSPLGNVTGGSPSAYTTTYAHNPFGDVTTTTDPLGHTTTKQYDSNRNVLSTTDPNNNVTQNTYDKDNELTLVTRADNSTNGYGYDADGNRTTVTDGLNHTTTYAYDPLNRLSSVTDALNRKTSYTYDGAGNRLTVVDPQTQTTTYAYDAANQMTSTTYSDGTTPNVTDVNYDGDGSRTAMTDGTGTSTFTYDSLRRLTLSTNGAGQTVGYGYDLKGQLTSITYPGGHLVQRAYDDAGRLTSVTDWLQHTTTYNVNPDSDVTSEAYANGTTATTTYDAADRSIGITDVNGTSTLASFTDTRNPDGTLASMTPTGVTQANESYGYNHLTQLTSVNAGTFTYDSGDNVTGLASGASLTYDAADEAVSYTNPPAATTTLSYDLRGNRVAGPVDGAPRVTLAYDQANRLTHVGSATVQVAGGAYHALALKADGTVWAWGSNGNGELGNGTTTSTNNPTQVPGLSGITAVSGGRNYSLALKSDGSVWAWGYNLYGQLGNGTTADSSVPVQVSGLAGVTAISAGGGHALAVKSDGTVWAWGENDQGQLGNGTTTNTSLPVQVTGLAGVSQVSGGGYHSVALKSDGTVWAWGYNGDGELANGTLNGSTTPIQVPGVTTATAVAVGNTHTLVLKSDGTVWASGQNDFGELGNGTTTNSASLVQASGLSGVTGIAAGFVHSLARMADGTVRTWGYNNFGQLGDGNGANSSTPVQPSNLTGISAVAGGGNFSLALGSDATAWSWGDDSSDQLGYAPPNGYSLVPQTIPALGNSVGVAMYTYDADGLRAAKISGGTTQRFTWDAAEGLPQLLTDGAYSYVYGAGGAPVEEVDANGNVTYFHQDQLGSTRLLTDSTGNVTATFTYDAYGSLTASTGPATTPLLYTGQYRDTESGFYYLRARYYDPTTAQFLTQDPRVSQTGAPYNYTSGNPLNRTDPTGQDFLGLTCDICGQALNAVGISCDTCGQVASVASDVIYIGARIAQNVCGIGQVLNPALGICTAVASGLTTLHDIGKGQYGAAVLDAFGGFAGYRAAATGDRLWGAASEFSILSDWAIRSIEWDHEQMHLTADDLYQWYEAQGCL